MAPRPTEPLPHYVSDAPFDPYSVEALTPEQERYYHATQWRLMWWKLRRHRLAVVSGVVLLLLYGSILVSEILAPSNPIGRASCRESVCTSVLISVVGGL